MFKYLKLAKLLEQVVGQGKQLKGVVYQSKVLKKGEMPSALSMLSLIVNNYSLFTAYHEQLCERTKQQISNCSLLIIMTAEFLNMGKIIGGGKLKKLIMDNQDLMPKLSRGSKINKLVIQLRLRHGIQGTQDIAGQLASVGDRDTVVPQLYHLKYEDYSALTKDKALNLLNSPACVIQSFSSSLPAFLLLQGVAKKWKGRTYDVIDACSAPGNKTVQLAEYLGQSGTVFAFEKHPRRYQLLNQTISKYGCGNVEAALGDFLEVSTCKKYRQVRFVLLDPSCSGSGMLANFTRDSNLTHDGDSAQNQTFEAFCARRYNELSQQQKERVQKLHDFQISLLSHAATFSPKRISYSTCSIYRRENEDVVESFLASHAQYRVKRLNVAHRDVCGGFGSGFQNCLRVDPRAMHSDGFFVTIFTKTHEVSK